MRNAAIRAILLANVADAALLRQQARAADAPQHERDLALFTLLYKEATRGPHADFARDLALVPADAAAQIHRRHFRQPDGRRGGRRVLRTPTPSGIMTARRSRNSGAGWRAPQDAKARLCLADFMRVGGYDGLFLDTQPPKD